MKHRNNNGKTIASIAQECGVSTMTVSRALRNGSMVKKDTRKRIVVTAELLGYIRSPRMGRPTVNGNGAALKIQLLENIRNSTFEATIIVGSFVPEQLKALMETVPEAVLLDEHKDSRTHIASVSFRSWKSGKALR